MLSLKTILKVIGASFAGLALALAILFYYGSSDHTKGYHLNLSIDELPGAIEAGFAKQLITPTQLDNTWLAGFSNNRKATGIHDPLWARVSVLRLGSTTIAIVALDAIGLMYDDVIEIRQLASKTLGLDYILISTTHTHQSPDTIGIWGEDVGLSGVDTAYLTYLKTQTVAAIKQALTRLEPVNIRHFEEPNLARSLVEDTRKPINTDHSLKTLVFYSKNTNAVLGSIVSWANHPEVLWSKNTLITADFVHYVRDGIENGVEVQGNRVPGLGGISLYINGAVGGLMTTSPKFSVRSLKTGEVLTGATYEKAEAVGHTLAYLALQKIHKTYGTLISESSLSLRVKTIYLPLKNLNFRLAMIAGVINRGLSGWARKVKTEIAYIELGPISILTIPGEIYPEIVNGGIVAPDGQDFQIEPQEVPAIRHLMAGKHSYVFGLSNDFIGYIIPKSQWDAEPPYTFQEKPYGEINSLGPNTAPIIYEEVKQLITN